MSGWRRWFSRAPGTGEPGKGVSSFHLWWQDAPPEPVVAVEVTLEVVEAPVVDRLYFWALQATFNDATTDHGGAHLGLQWNPRYPGSRAANWGGYPKFGQWGAVLQGTPSPLPSTPNDPNTRDYPWQQGVPYRLRISRSDVGLARRDHRHDDRAHAAGARPSHRRRPADVGDDVVGGLRPVRSPERDGPLVEARVDDRVGPCRLADARASDVPIRRRLPEHRGRHRRHRHLPAHEHAAHASRRRRARGSCMITTWTSSSRSKTSPTLATSASSKTC